MHNIATLWNEELPEGEEDDVEDNGDNVDQDQDQDPERRVNYALSDVQIRRIGQAERDNMLRVFIP